jgi:hypothetical protein
MFLSAGEVHVVKDKCELMSTSFGSGEKLAQTRVALLTSVGGSKNPSEAEA